VDAETPMKSAARRQNPIERLLSLFRRPTPTEQLLRSRNARLIVQDGDGQSFHVVRLTPRCDVVAAGKPIRLRVKIIADQMVRVTLEDRTAKTTFVDVTAPIDPGADVMYLNYGDIHLRIEVDAARPGES
jgi:hypothetical protein